MLERRNSEFSLRCKRAIADFPEMVAENFADSIIPAIQKRLGRYTFESLKSRVLRWRENGITAFSI